MVINFKFARTISIFDFKTYFYIIIPIFFRPLTSKEYILNLNVFYADEAYYTSSKTDEIDLYNNSKEKEDGIERIGRIPVTIRGYGYHPKKFTPPKILSPFAKMPKERIQPF